MLDNLFSSVGTLQKGLNASWLRNEAISNNIANIDTPGFKTSHIQFEDLLAETVDEGQGALKMAVTHENHMHAVSASRFDNVDPEIVTDESTSTRLDGNNVNIDNEMVELAKNSINYYATVSKINAEFRKLSSAISVT